MRAELRALELRQRASPIKCRARTVTARRTVFRKNIIFIYTTTMTSHRAWILWIFNSLKCRSSVLFLIGPEIPLDPTDQSACGGAGSTRQARSKKWLFCKTTVGGRKCCKWRLLLKEISKLTPRWQPFHRKPGRT